MNETQRSELMDPPGRPTSTGEASGNLYFATILAFLAVAIGRVLGYYPFPLLLLIDSTVGRDDYYSVVILIKGIELLVIICCFLAVTQMITCHARASQRLTGDRVSIQRSCAVGLSCTVVALLVAGAGSWVGSYLDNSASDRDSLIASFASISPLRVILFLLIAAVGEELLFRGLLFRLALGYGIGERGVILIVTSLLFAVWHWPWSSLLEAVVLFALSCVFGLARVSGGLLAAVLCHFLYNAKVLLAM